MGFKVENLRVWELALDYSLEINKLIKKFPSGEKYVLAQQLQRAADSIELNIAEGSTGQTNVEFKEFLGYSIRSGIEALGCFHLGRKRGIIVENEFLDIYASTENLIVKLQSLRININ